MSAATPVRAGLLDFFNEVRRQMLVGAGGRAAARSRAASPPPRTLAPPEASPTRCYAQGKAKAAIAAAGNYDVAATKALVDTAIADNPVGSWGRAAVRSVVLLACT